MNECIRLSLGYFGLRGGRGRIGVAICIYSASPFGSRQSEAFSFPVHGTGPSEFIEVPAGTDSPSIA